MLLPLRHLKRVLNTHTHSRCNGFPVAVLLNLDSKVQDLVPFNLGSHGPEHLRLLLTVRSYADLAGCSSRNQHVAILLFIARAGRIKGKVTGTNTHEPFVEGMC